MSNPCAEGLEGGSTRRTVTINRVQERTIASVSDNALMVVQDNLPTTGIADLIVQDADTDDCTILVVKTPIFIETEHDQDFDR